MERTSCELVRYTIEQLNSYMFLCDYRTSPEHFSRTSPLGFFETASIILRLVKKSAKAELMDFFYEIKKSDITPSRQALNEARQKISHLAFKDFFEKSCELATKGSDKNKLLKL